MCSFYPDIQAARREVDLFRGWIMRIVAAPMGSHGRSIAVTVLWSPLEWVEMFQLDACTDHSHRFWAAISVNLHVCAPACSVYWQVRDIRYYLPVSAWFTSAHHLEMKFAQWWMDVEPVLGQRPITRSVYQREYTKQQHDWRPAGSPAVGDAYPWSGTILLAPTYV